MKFMRIWLGCVLAMGLVFASSGLQAKVVSQDVDYRVNDQVFKGYLAYDDAIKVARPGVLVVHEWWGHNPYARKRAEMLAEMGYVAMALDMYGDGVQAKHPGDAGQFASSVLSNLDVAKQRFLAAMDVLKQHPRCDAEKIAAIGYCFGGAVVLNMARMGVDLDGVASFHGSLATSHPAEKGSLVAQILVCHGEDDGFVTSEQIEAFHQEMNAAEAVYQFKIYPGAKHSFTNPDADRFGAQFDLPLAYNRPADKQSWKDLEQFLKKIWS